MTEPATPAEGRDLRLDLLRGLCVARMIVVHLGWNSDWIRFPFGLVTAAEGFFLISGVTLGKVGRRYADDGRAGELARRLVLRSAWLWIANTALVLLLRRLDGTCAVPEGALAGHWLETPRWQQILSFDQPSVLPVLPRYVVFLLLAPVVLAALRAGRGAWILVASVALWAANSLVPGGLALPYFEGERALFPLAAWQLLFVVGLLIGYRRPAGDRARRPPLGGFAFASALLLAVAFVLFERLGLARAAAADPGAVFVLFGREALGPGRLLNLAALGVVLFALTDRFRDRLVSFTGWLLLPLGTKALAAFLLHVPLCWWVFCLRPAEPDRLFAPLYAGAGLLVVALAVRWRPLTRALAPF
jgi:hypothetical protein